jgi:RNA polymerase sigma-70 factor, ECF subfamily
MTMTVPPFAAEARSRRGDPGPMDEVRFDMFYRRTAPSLWSYLNRVTGDAATADDLLQKSFFHLLRTNPVFASEEHQRRWMFRTATNLALDHFREARRNRRYATVARQEVVGDAAESREMLRHDMMSTFAQLKPQERALLWLAHVEELDHEDIGAALGVKTKSVKVLLFRARKRLGELLTRKGLAPEVVR